MKAMILAAGRGQRLRPLTDHVPKVLAEVGGESLLSHQLHWLAAAGIRDIVINLHHLGEQIVDAFGDGAAFGVNIAYSREPELLETGGGIVRALPLLGDEPFVVMNGDIYTEFPLTELRTRLAPTAQGHLVVTPRPDFRRDGDFDLDGQLVTRRGATYVYCGIAVLHPLALGGRGPGAFSLRDVYFSLMERRALTAQIWRGYWSDIGSADQLEAVNAHHRRAHPDPT